MISAGSDLRHDQEEEKVYKIFGKPWKDLRQVKIQKKNCSYHYSIV